MRKPKFVSVFALLTLLSAVLSTGTVAPPIAKAQQSPPIPIQVDGQTILLELGENVHPQTYNLLSRDPGFASREDIKWVFVDDMWVPLKRTEERPLRETPIPEKTPSPGPSPEYIPECRITLNVPAYSQCGSSWRDDCLYHLPYAEQNPDLGHYCTCGTMCSQGCAITSATMVFRYYGANDNPGEVNGCCGDHGCRYNCRLLWQCAADHCSDNQAGFVDYHPFRWSKLCAMLSESRPPIVNVGGHFVVVYKSNGYDLDDACDYYISDPADGTTYKKLCYYTQDPLKIAEYYNK